MTAARRLQLTPGAKIAAGVLALVAVVAWAGPKDLLDSIIRGFPLGCVFALMAVGIVLAYKTSGVLNLAFAAQAFVSAAVFFDLRARHGWSLPLALVVSVVVVAPLLGLVLDLLVFRHLRSASSLAKLVTSLGLLVAIPEITKLWFGQGAAFDPPSIFPGADHIFRMSSYALDGNQVGTIIVTIVCVGGLTALFRWSSIGLQMRAVVESPRLAELHGVNSDRVSAYAWMLSSLFAGLAGVLLAPLFAQVEANNFFTLLVAALAAAAFGRLTSIPWTFAGAILLAVLMQLFGTRLDPTSVLAQNLRPALPFVVLILLLLFWPGLGDKTRGHRSALGRRPAATRADRCRAPAVADDPDPHACGGRGWGHADPRVHHARRLLGGEDHRRGHPLDLLPLLHGDHRDGRAHLALPGHLRRSRRPHDRPSRQRHAHRRAHGCAHRDGGRWGGGRGRRPPGTASVRHLPRARHAGVRDRSSRPLPSRRAG